MIHSKYWDYVIIGSGIVGLSVARELYARKKESSILIIEKENAIGLHASGRNSGVLHSGIYYPEDSLKAKICASGSILMSNYCKEKGLPINRIGKIILPINKNDDRQLELLYKRATTNNASVEFIDSKHLKIIEPEVKSITGNALFSPNTSVVDPKSIMLQLQKDLEKKDICFMFNAALKDIDIQNSTININNNHYQYGMLINTAGQYSDKIAHMCDVGTQYALIPFRGEYYKLKPDAQRIVNNLIYPVPNPSFPFLGVHFTRMIDGSVECGPNAVFAFAKEGYNRSDFSSSDIWDCIKWPGFRKIITKYWKEGVGEYYRSIHKEAFVKALQKLIPNIKSDDLIPGGSGVRAQACDINGNLLDDFDIRIDGNVIHVCNAPSPAATASLAIAETISSYVVKLLK